MTAHSTRMSPMSRLLPKQFWTQLWGRVAPRPKKRTPTTYHAADGLSPFTFRTRRGQAVAVRRVALADVAAIQAFVSQLSDRTRGRRYMTTRPLTGEAAQQEARRIAGGHTPDQVTLLASNDATGEIIAVAEIIRDARQPEVGELALVVRDDAQNDGVGSTLLRQLFQLAPLLGLTQLRADVLAENRPMRALIGKLGLPYTSTRAYDALDITWQLTAPEAQQLAAAPAL